MISLQQDKALGGEMHYALYLISASVKVLALYIHGLEPEARELSLALARMPSNSSDAFCNHLVHCFSLYFG